jgi:hypothetical protein
VLWATASTAGENAFIGHPNGDKAGKVLVLALGAEVGFEVDADDCSSAGRRNPNRGPEYRQRYFRIIQADWTAIYRRGGATFCGTILRPVHWPSSFQQL